MIAENQPANGFKEGDRVRLIKGVPFARPLRSRVGTVLKIVDDGTSLARLDVHFDGEDESDPGVIAGLFEPDT